MLNEVHYIWTNPKLEGLGFESLTPWISRHSRLLCTSLKGLKGGSNQSTGIGFLVDKIGKWWTGP